MSQPAILNLREMEGVQHCHGENCDEYWYRPVVYGDDLFTYVAHIPPGGGVPGDQEEADMYEMSLYILSGHPKVNYADQEFTMSPHTALHCPRGVPVGFSNPTSEPVSLILSFTPAPSGANNPKEMRKFLEGRGRTVFTADAMNEMAGSYLSTE